MFKQFSFIVLLTAVVSTTALAEPKIKATNPINNDPIRDFRIENCPSIKGIGAFTYSLGRVSYVLEMGDICIDEKSGKVISVESVSNLTMVSKTKKGRSFEILRSGRDKYSRVRLDLRNNEIVSINCGPDVTGSSLINLWIPKKKYIRSHKGSINVRFEGHSLGPVSLTPLKDKSSKVYISLRPLSDDGKGNRIGHGLNVDVYGSFQMSANSGSIDLKASFDESVGEAAGKVGLTVDDKGEVIAKGEFEFKSPRLAGHQPEEWVTMKGKILYARGHFLGEKGQHFNAYGIAKGTYINAVGKKHNFRSKVYLTKCFLDKE